MDMIRIDAVMMNVDKAAFLAYLENPEQTDMLKEFRKIEDLPAESAKLYYMRLKMPLMSERDNLMKIVQQEFDDGTLFISCSSVNRDDFPPK
jgi:hypothetical protein